MLSFVAAMPLLYGDHTVAAYAYASMHPEVTASEPGTCPICGMTLVPAPPAPLPMAEPHHGQEHLAHAHGEHHEGDGLEWEDLMPEINRRSDASNMHWKIIDRHTGAENGAIAWVLHVDVDNVKTM